MVTAQCSYPGLQWGKNQQVKYKDTEAFSLEEKGMSSKSQTRWVWKQLHLLKELSASSKRSRPCLQKRFPRVSLEVTAELGSAVHAALFAQECKAQEWGGHGVLRQGSIQLLSPSNVWQGRSSSVRQGQHLLQRGSERPLRRAEA